MVKSILMSVFLIWTSKIIAFTGFKRETTGSSANLVELC